MFGINWLQKISNALSGLLITGVLVLSLVSCGDRFVDSDLRAATPSDRSGSPAQLSGSISEVSPPEVIQELRSALENYQPQVAILNPQPNEVLRDDTLTVKLQVQDLPIFKNQELDMGPYLHVILDNQPDIAVYDLNQPLIFPDLSPGTHTLRVFASRPWHESFKNEGAYAQTTFHIFTKTQDNNPDAAQPLLTYSRPKGSYGAEPILLDFYLTNAPLHLVAQEDSKDDIADWRIRCTVNGNSFILDRWQPVYLQGFKPGKNWVQLEFLDEKGNSVKNVFSNTARLINYEPKGKDPLSKLVRGELTAAEARGIVDPNYTTSTTTTPTPSPTPPAQTLPETQLDADRVTNAETKESAPTSKTEPKNLKNKKPGGFFNRRRPTAPPSPSLPPTLPEAIETPAPESIVPEVTPAPENQPEPQPLKTPPTATTPEVEQTPLAKPGPQKFKLQKQKSGGLFSRFRRPTATPSPDLPPTLPEIIEPSSPEVIPPETTPQTETPEPDSVPPTSSLEPKRIN